MNTKYNYDRFNDLGFEIEYKRNINIYSLVNRILRFTNRNDVTTISNWIGVAVGIIGVIIML